MEATIVGYGQAGKRIHRLLSQAGVRVTAVADPDPTATLGIDVATVGIDKVLEESAGRVVAVASPSRFHAEHALRAIYGGCGGLIIEKPLALDYAGADRVAAAAKTAGVRGVVWYQWRFHPVVASLHCYRDKLFGFHLRTSEDPTTWPNNGAAFMVDSSHGGGVVHTSLTHSFSVLSALIPGKIRRVSGGIKLNDAGVEVSVVGSLCPGNGSHFAAVLWTDGLPSTVLSFLTHGDYVTANLRVIAEDVETMHRTLTNSAIKYVFGGDLDPLLCTLAEAATIVSWTDAVRVANAEQRIVTLDRRAPFYG